MDRLTTRKPPSLRRGIATGLGIALVVSVLGFSNDASEFAATFLTVSALGVGFFAAWSYWDKQPRRVSFDVVWLGFVIVGALVFFTLLLSTGTSIQMAAFASIGPALFVISSWLVLVFILVKRR